MRKSIIAGNWKMYKTPTEARELVTALLKSNKPDINTEVLICPPFTALLPISHLTRESWIKLGAQNLHWEKEGAYTGEVSAPMLKACGCSHVIIGHSERRSYFGETNETVNKKVKAALQAELTPIVCVGETLAEREAGETFQVIGKQLREGLAGLSEEEAKRGVIAYEPVWAIGTGKTATPAQAEEVHQFIRGEIRTYFGATVADGTPILYGGSVKPDNIQALMKQENIDGALVGGASLKAEDFLKLVHYQD